MIPAALLALVLLVGVAHTPPGPPTDMAPAFGLPARRTILPALQPMVI